MTILNFSPVLIKPIEDSLVEETSTFLFLNWCNLYQHFNHFTEKRDRQFFLDMVTKSKAPIWVAVFNNRVVGVVVTMSNCIDYIIVDREFRQRKIGSKLLNEAVQYFKKRGFKNIQVGIEDFNKEGNSFFSALGWKNIGSEHINFTNDLSVEAFVFSKAI